MYSRKIVGTTVFVKINENGEGTLTTSEISPGRIRNLRNYVVPGKKIICKILSIQGGNIHLSLRRVKQHERKELLERLSKEKSSEAILKTVLGKEKAKEVIKEITKQYSVLEFLEKAKKDPKTLEKYINKSLTEKIIKILDSKKKKPKEIRQIIEISNKSPNGIQIIKEILINSCNSSECSIKYLSAGKYSLTLKGEDYKKLKAKLHEILKIIEKKAKKSNSTFLINKP